MPLYIGDYLRDTTAMTAAEHGAYLLLIMDYWVNGPLPDDDRKLALIARTPLNVWRRYRRGQLIKKFTCHGGCWMHKRVEIERARAKDAIGQRRAAGLASAAARRAQNGTAKPNARSNDRRNLVRDSVRVPLQSKEEGLAPYEANPVSLTPREPTPPLPSQGDGDAVSRSTQVESAEPAEPDPPTKAEGAAAFKRCIDAINGKLGVLDSDASVPPPPDPRLVEFRARLSRLNTIAGTKLRGELRMQAWEVLAAADSLADPLALSPAMLAELDAIERLGAPEQWAEAAE
jgi:uncharacterized protein YdaU (DUF1376 family)